jgi:hypothetical protein
MESTGPFLARIVEGPIPAIHAVVRWRACDLTMRPACRRCDPQTFQHAQAAAERKRGDDPVGGFGALPAAVVTLARPRDDAAMT